MWNKVEHVTSVRKWKVHLFSSLFSLYLVLHGRVMVSIIFSYNCFRVKWINFHFVNKSALKCYTCTKTPNSGDDACVDDVESLGKAVITNCAKKYCTIFRQELLDPAGKVNSFTRGCEDEPIVSARLFDH